MNVFLINRFFYPDHSATSQLLTDLAFHLAKSEMNISIITSRQVYDNPDAVMAHQERVQGVRIMRVWSSRFGRQGLWGRTLDYSTFYLSALWRLFRVVRADDVVIAKTDPPLISIVAAIVTKCRRAVLVNWVQDLFPEVVSALVVQGTGWLEYPLRSLRNISLRAARRNVVIGEGMAKKLRDEGIPSDRIRVIHNWADGLAIRPVERERNELRQQWDLDDKFVVGYSGNFGRAHEFDTILSAAEILHNCKNVAFVFIGGGAQLESMKQAVRAKRLTNVIFRPYQPRDQLSLSLSVPDIHVISLLPALEGLIIPSKFYGIAAAGRPMLYIGDKSGEIAQIIRNAECGFTLEIGQAKEIVSVIQQLAQDEHMCSQLGCQARILFDHRFNKVYAEKAWERIIAEVAMPCSGCSTL